MTPERVTALWDARLGKRDVMTALASLRPSPGALRQVRTQADLVVLARYTQILSNDLVGYLAGRCLPIHYAVVPALRHRLLQNQRRCCDTSVHTGEVVTGVPTVRGPWSRLTRVATLRRKMISGV